MAFAHRFRAVSRAVLIMAAMLLVSCGGAGKVAPSNESETASKEYDFWFRAAYEQVSREFKVPDTLGKKLECVVRFEVLPSGDIEQVEVRKASGNVEFDEACRLAVVRSSPLPPLPHFLEKEKISITIPFTNR